MKINSGKSNAIVTIFIQHMNTMLAKREEKKLTSSHFLLFYNGTTDFCIVFKHLIYNYKKWQFKKKKK